ncbi:hypothetical protein [Streptomyces eurythermus]|uniref:hypothetical protein n=1 Tax=Streptomyces eurythermus TaxID=42237 RepID=UPI0036D362A6
MLEVAGSPAGRPIDVTVDSIAADSLGARRTSTMALNAARQDHVYSVLAPDTEIIRARQMLWDHRGLAVEHGAATRWSRSPRGVLVVGMTVPWPLAGANSGGAATYSAVHNRHVWPETGVA